MPADITALNHTLRGSPVARAALLAYLFTPMRSIVTITQ